MASPDAFGTLAQFAADYSGNGIEMDAEAGYPYYPHITGFDSEEYLAIIEKAAKAESAADRAAALHEAEEMLAQPKMADYMVIATQDAQHKDHALKAMELGYDLVLEKPISNKLEDIVMIANKAKELGAADVDVNLEELRKKRDDNRAFGIME